MLVGRSWDEAHPVDERVRRRVEVNKVDAL